MGQEAVGVVGLGPVGTILGSYLVRSGLAVYGVEKKQDRVAQVNADGFIVRGFAELNEKPVKCFDNQAEVAQIDNLSCLFICTKTWAIEDVMREFVELSWPRNMRVMAFMNGIGPEDAMAVHAGGGRVCRGVINFAGNLDEEGAATMNWFHPPNLIGPATDRKPRWTPQLEETLTAVGLNTTQVSYHEMKKAAFYKTVLNSALNALCAAHGLTMRQAMRLKHTRRMARVLMREGLTVAGLVGYNYGEDTLDRSIGYLDAGGEHYPSMWFDLRNHTPTEIEYINGKIVKIGRMFNDIDVSLNTFFTSAIVTEEILHGARREDDIPEYLIDA